MTDPASIDIVIDNYNYGPFLAASIDSALAQRYPHTRVLVVDDGSTDSSREVIARYGDRVESILKPNGGQASAFNAGWEHCRGDIVMFLDADDVLLPHAAERVAAAFTRAPRLAKVQYRLAVIDSAGERTGELKPAAHIRLPSGDLRRLELTLPFDIPWMATSGNAFAASALEQIMPIPEAEFAASADWYLQHLVPLLGDVASLPEVCACYRVHGANGYEPTGGFDVAHVRQSVIYATATRRHLRRMASTLGLPLPPGPILSVADLANRVISVKLEPDAHPLPHDRVGKLALSGTVAALRRYDVRWPMKLTFICWFAAMLLAPRRAAQPLAEAFVQTRRRPWLNDLLGKLAKPSTSPGARVTS